MKQIMHTPWGPSHSRNEIAPGIISVTTASHGGIYLDETRWVHFRSLYPTQKTWAGDHWLEEDCDWSLVPIAFPEHYDDEVLFYAIRFVRDYKMDDNTTPYFPEAVAYLQTDPGKVLVARAESFRKTIETLWERGSMGTGGDGWMVWFHRGEETQVIKSMPYPTKTFYTDEELAPFERVKPKMQVAA